MPPIQRASAYMDLDGERFMGETDSRMLDSEGWATINGGGFSWIALYSRVNCPRC